MFKNFKLYFGIALIFGLLSVVNLSKSDNAKTTDATKAQVGWAMSKYVAQNEPGGAWDTVTKAGYTTVGGMVGGKYGAAIGGAVGGPVGALGGAMIGAL